MTDADKLQELRRAASRWRDAELLWDVARFYGPDKQDIKYAAAGELADAKADLMRLAVTP